MSFHSFPLLLTRNLRHMLLHMPEFIDLVFATTGSINSGKGLTHETNSKAHDWDIKSTLCVEVDYGVDIKVKL
jgi:hypothetical protein